MPNGAQDTVAESVKFGPSALVELFELDATSISTNAGIFRFYNGTLPTGNPVVWQGHTYTTYAVKADGFEFKAQGELPRPKIQFANLFGSFTALNLNYADLVGAVIRRRRVFYRHLDTHIGGVPPNPDGTYNDNPDANPNAGWPMDVYYLHQKTQQNKTFVEYEMTSILELENVQLPGRQVFSNLCASLYRSTECSYTGLPVGDVDGNPVPIDLGANKGLLIQGTHYVPGDFGYIVLNAGRKAFFVCVTANDADELSFPPNKAFWFADDCSRCLVSGCNMRYPGSTTKPFAAFPGTQSLPTSAG